MSQTFLPEDKGSRKARESLPNPLTTNSGPVAVVVVDGVPYRFHLVSAPRGSAVWKRVEAFGPQCCARPTCTNTFVIEPGPVASMRKLYCCHSCRGRAAEARRVSIRTAPFDAVSQTMTAARSYTPPPPPQKKVRGRRAPSVSQGNTFTF